jgi:hypothetical protein
MEEVQTAADSSPQIKQQLWPGWSSSGGESSVTENLETNIENNPPLKLEYFYEVSYSLSLSIPPSHFLSLDLV